MDRNFSGKLPWSDENEIIELGVLKLRDLIGPSSNGLILQFGVHKGSWLDVVAQAAKPKTVYGFDSFKGVPDDWGRFKKGTWALSDGQLASIKWPDNSKIVTGWFADTLPDFMNEHPGGIAYAHINVGLYSSARDVLDNIGPRIGVNSILHFGAIRQIKDCAIGEIRAFNEFLGRHDNQVWEVIGRTGGTDAVFRRLNDKWH